MITIDRSLDRSDILFALNAVGQAVELAGEEGDGSMTIGLGIAVGLLTALLIEDTEHPGGGSRSQPLPRGVGRA